MLQFLLIPVFVGAAAILSGCGSSTSSDAARGDGSASPGPSGSSLVPAGSAPPPIGSGNLPPRPAPAVLAPIDVGTAPARNERETTEAYDTRVRTWAAEQAITRRYIAEYNNTTPGVYTPQVAIREAIRMIIRETGYDARTNRSSTPLRVSYTLTAGGASVPITVDDPISLFVRKLLEAHPEARTDAEAALRELTGGEGGAGDGGAPRPSVPPVPRERPARPAGSHTPRPTGPANGAGAREIL